MNMNQHYVLLSNGNRIPQIGLGTDDVLFVRGTRVVKYRILNRLLSAYYTRILRPILNFKMSNRFCKAFKAGYRLIDTSAAYYNEASIGRAIKMSGIPREDFFITTRATNQMQYKGTVRKGFFESLRRFDLEYVDLYMLHWPVDGYYIDAWKDMESLYEEGYIKNLGMANCHRHHLEEILKKGRIRPVLNQVEVHPLLSQKELIAYCHSEGIQVEAYTPLARNDDRLRKNRILNSLAQKYNKSRSQIILRWQIENGVIPVPRSMHVKRMIENYSVFDFSLTKDEVKQIDSININSRLRYDPDNCDFTLL